MDIYVLSFYFDASSRRARSIVGLFLTRLQAQEFSAIHAGVSRTELWDTEGGEYGVPSRGSCYRIEVHRLGDPLTIF